MSQRDEIVDIELPFFRIYIGERGPRIRFGADDGEDMIDMETYERDEYRDVRRRVRARLRFFRHAVTFVAVAGAFVLVDWLSGGSGSGVNWSKWVALVWGIFLAWEFASTFVAPLLWGRDLEERLIQRELQRRRQGG